MGGESRVGTRTMARTKKTKRKSKGENSKRFKVKVGERHVVQVTTFKGSPFIHLNDTRKEKSVSFSKAAFVKFLKKTNKIQKLIHQCEKDERMRHTDDVSSCSSDNDNDDDSEDSE